MTGELDRAEYPEPWDLACCVEADSTVGRETGESQGGMRVLDQYDLFSGLDGYLPYAPGAQARQTGSLSHAYFRSPEDLLYEVAVSCQNDCVQKLRNLGERDTLDAGEFYCGQAQALTIQRLCIEEIRRLAVQAQIRGYVGLLRTYLAQINQDTAPFILEACPGYTKYARAEQLQYGFLLSAADHAQLDHINSIPHAVSLVAGQYSVYQLEIILTFLVCFETAFRFGALKNNLVGKKMYDVGEKLSELLEFLSEVSRVKINEIDTHVISVPSVTYLEQQDLDYLQSQLKHPAKFSREELKYSAQCLEQAKVKLALQKAVQLRDALELLMACAYVQSANLAERKGLFQQAAHFREQIKVLSQRLKIGIKLSQGVPKPQKIFKNFIDTAERRLYDQSLNASPEVQQPPATLNKGFSNCPQAVPLHQFNQMMLGQPRNEGVSIQEAQEYVCGSATRPGYYQVAAYLGSPYLSPDDSATCHILDIYNYLQRERFVTRGEKKLGQAWANSFSSASRDFWVQSQLTPIEHYIANVGIGTDGSSGLFTPFGIDSTLNQLDTPRQQYTTFSSTLTALELDAVYISSAVRQTRSEKQLQNQWTQYKYLSALAQNWIYLDRLSCTFEFLSGCDADSNILAFTGQFNRDAIIAAFKKIFDRRVEELPKIPWDPLKNSYQNQLEKIKQVNAKRDEQTAFLDHSFFLFLEEQPLDAIFTQKDVQVVQESVHFFRYLFVDACEHNLRAFYTSVLLNALKENADSLKMGIKLSQSLPPMGPCGVEISEQYIGVLQNMRLGNEMSDVLSPFCKGRPDLNPFVTNVSQALQPTILNVVAGVVGLQDFSTHSQMDSYVATQRTQQMRQLVKILGGQELGSGYVQHVLEWLNFLAVLYPNFAAGKILQKARQELYAMFEKYSKPQYGPQAFGGSGNAGVQVVPLGIHLDDIIAIFQKIAQYKQGVQLSVRVYQQQQLEKFTKFYTIQRQNAELAFSSTQPQLKAVQQGIAYRSLAVLNPQATECVLAIDELQKSVFEHGIALIQEENTERAKAHDEYQEKFADLLEKILHVKELQKSIIHSRNKQTKKAVGDVRLGATEIYSKAIILTDFCKLPLDTQLEQLDIRFQKIIQESRSTDGAPFQEDRQKIVETYQQNIKEARGMLEEIKTRALVMRTFTNYLLQAKKLVLEFAVTKTNAELREEARQVWEHIGETFCIEKQMESMLDTMTRVIAQKMSHVNTMKAKLEFSGKLLSKQSREGGKTPTAAGKNVAAIIKKSLYKQTALKTLPMLNNIAMTRALKICNEGETMTVIYKQKVDQYNKLIDELNAVQADMKAHQLQFNREMQEIKRNQMREQDVLGKSTARKAEIEQQTLQIQKQIELQEELTKQKAQYQQDKSLTQLSAEKELVTQQIQVVDARIRQLYDKNPQLFDAVGDQIENVILQFDSVETNGLAARGRAKSRK